MGYITLGGGGGGARRTWIIYLETLFLVMLDPQVTLICEEFWKICVHTVDG